MKIRDFAFHTLSCVSYANAHTKKANPSPSSCEDNSQQELSDSTVTFCLIALNKLLYYMQSKRLVQGFFRFFSYDFYSFFRVKCSVFKAFAGRCSYTHIGVSYILLAQAYIVVFTADQRLHIGSAAAAERLWHRQTFCLYLHTIVAIWFFCSKNLQFCPPFVADAIPASCAPQNPLFFL